MTAHRFDIGIIGAGPAGSSAATLLAARGYSVCLVDKCTFPRHKLCGDFLNPINWPLLERLGVADELFALGHQRVATFRISADSGGSAMFPFPVQQGQPSFGLGVSRYHLDYLLLKRAIQAGVTIFQGNKVKALKQAEDHWSVELIDSSGQRTLRPTFLIGADGRHSRVAQLLGLAKAHQRGRRYAGFQLHLQGVKQLDGEVQIHLFPGGYGGLVEIGGGMANLCLTLETLKLKNPLPVEEVINECLIHNPRLKEALKGSHRVGGIRSVYPVHASRRRSFGQGFVLVGDAAYAPEPITGEGIYFALKSGAIAAQVIHQGFVKGDRSANQAARYEAAWQRSLSWRRKTNTVIRTLVTHPALLRPLIRISSKCPFPTRPLIHSVLRNNAQSTYIEHGV